MKKIYLTFLSFSFLFAFACLTQAQDTVRVQTFDWDSQTRSEVFQFPDDPGASYRKILMKYNMRCHDAAVGSGNVGCYEWDYSCNTFITDSSRVDSTRELHPSHVISNFSGTEFSYTTDLVFDQTRYTQYQTDLMLTDEVTANIGSGTTPLTLSGSQPTARAQFLYLANEMLAAGLAAGDIHALDLMPAQAGQVDFLRVRLKAVSATELDAENPDLEGFTEVYFKNTMLNVGGPQRLVFYQPFNWDGTSNLLVELSFTQTPNGTEPSILGTPTIFTSSIFAGPSDFALLFSGPGIVDVPAEKFATVSDEITVSLWANGTPEIMPANSTIFEGVDDGGRRQVNVHLPWSNGQVYWDCGDDGSGYDRINKPANESDYEGQWNHWAFTKNAATGEMKIYLNGNLWHSGTGKTKPITVTDFIIGRGLTGDLGHYGLVDEFRVWDKELAEAEIQAWMRKPLDATHPNYDNLIAYFPMDEGVGNNLTDASGNGDDATAFLPYWNRIRGKDLFKNFFAAPLRPDVAFVQGQATISNQEVAVTDQVPAPLHSVVFYEVEGTDLVATDTQFFYQAGYSYVYDEMGNLVDSVWNEPENTIEITDLEHYLKRPAKYEILSLVTPYGNGLDLGDDGKTFTFDVTDYAPILKGEKRMSIELGGQWQEELDIEFLFIKGTPQREVLDIQNIWPFRRAWYGQLQDDRYFEPRTVALMQDGQYFKLRSAVTGHGQNGEFVPRTHYLNLDGGSQDFTYQVWKECADNPIYPQGGTWIFDRAGWCPGAATDVHEFDITNSVFGGSVEVDYGVNGAFMNEANYLVSNQLVTYGSYNFTTDASLERIARPNNTDVEFERINPACASPIIWVKNNGTDAITNLKIEYKVQGGSMVETFDWQGSIAQNAIEEIELPVTDMGFWETAGPQIFEAKILEANGSTDEYADNDSATSQFETATIYGNDKDYVLAVRTNNNGSEYSYIIKNADGDIVLERDNMASNTTYEDDLVLPPGCYTMQFFDEGHDGLSFWFFPNNGNGSLQIKRWFNQTALLPVKSFDPDFGSGVQFDFVMEDVIGAVGDDLSFRAVSTYPNPATDAFQLELRGFAGREITWELTNLQGQRLKTQTLTKIISDDWSMSVDLEDFSPGMYLLKISDGEKVWVKDVVKF